MGVKDTISGFFGNDIVKAGTFGAGVEGVNMLAQNYLGMGNPAFGEVFGNVKGAVDGVLNYTGANSIMAANPVLTAGLSSVGAGLLSNTVLKDIGLNDDGKGIKSLKNLSRYALNAGAMVGTYSAGTAAAPYLIAGAGAYFAGKYGWRLSGKALKLVGEGIKRTTGTAWGLTGGLVKGAAIGAYNSLKAGLKGEQKLNPVI